MSQEEKEEKTNLKAYMTEQYPEMLKNLYVYLECNLAPSQLIKRNKQKKIDSMCL